MGLFTRKQGSVATISAMSEFSNADREHGMDMLQDTEEVFVGLGAPSRLAVSVFSAVMSTMGVDDESPAYGVAGGPMQMGYACRMSDDSNELSGALATAFISQLALDDDGTLIYEEMAEDPSKFTTLVEYVATIADDPQAITALAGATDGAWNAFSTTATFQLHRNFVRNGLPKGALPDHDSIENLLRLGYALRLLDEVSGEPPIDKAGRPIAEADRYADARRRVVATQASSDTETVSEQGPGPDPDLPAGADLDVDAWLSASTSVATNDFEQYVERILELGTLDRLGIWTVFDFMIGERPKPKKITDDVVTAMSNARLGYAMRNREIQLVDVADTDGEGPLAKLFDERSEGVAGINMAMIDGVLRDVLYLHFDGGPERLYETTPGTTPEIRRRAINQWADEHYPGADPTVGFDITVALLEYGYFLHRLIELRPEILPD